MNEIGGAIQWINDPTDTAIRILRSVPPRFRIGLFTQDQVLGKPLGEIKLDRLLRSEIRFSHKIARSFFMRNHPPLILFQDLTPNTRRVNAIFLP